MKQIKSTFVAADGEAKCGKTTVIGHITGEAQYQADLFGQFTDAQYLEETWNFSPDSAAGLATNVSGMLDAHGFQNIVAISAGNTYRAAALYQALLEINGVTKPAFEASDADEIRRLLAIEGIEDVLQNDPNIGASVSRVAQFAGVQSLCGALFADTALEAYQRDGGGNLVVADARDPIGHLLRNGMIGTGENQIDPSTIVPLYIDTPADVAAERMPGVYEENLIIVENRRFLDATRAELPVVRPEVLIDDFTLWEKLLAEARAEGTIPPMYRVNNNRAVDLGNIQRLGGVVATLASDIGIINYANLDIVDKITA